MNAQLAVCSFLLNGFGADACRPAQLTPISVITHCLSGLLPCLRVFLLLYHGLMSVYFVCIWNEVIQRLVLLKFNIDQNRYFIFYICITGLCFMLSLAFHPNMIYFLYRLQNFLSVSSVFWYVVPTLQELSIPDG